MSDIPELKKFHGELRNSLASIQSVNGELIRYSQRLGRLIIRFQKLDLGVAGIMTWLDGYQSVKQVVIQSEITLNETVKKISSLKNTEKMSELVQDELTSHDHAKQWASCYAKIEIIDDIMSGLLEDMHDDKSYEKWQVQLMRQRKQHDEGVANVRKIMQNPPEIFG